MQSRKGSINTIVAGFVVLAIVIAGVLVYKFISGSGFSTIKNYSQNSQIPVEQDLTKSDEISDIEKDLNSTSTDNLDADILEITSEVE